MGITIVIASSIIVFSESHKKHSTALWVLNIASFLDFSIGHCYNMSLRNSRTSRMVIFVSDIRSDFVVFG